MARARNTRKPAAAKTAAKADEVVEAAKPAKAERLTSFESRGSRFFRLTVPRSWGEEHLASAGSETWDFEERADGTLVFTPRTRVVKA